MILKAGTFSKISFFTLITFLITISSSSAQTIRFGIMSLAQPSRIHAQWQPFVDYVSNKTGYNIEIVIPRGFKKINSEIEKNKIDIFYTNSFIFYRLNKSGKALALAQMKNTEGSIMSQSVIFVRDDSGINKITDLKNSSFAFISPAGAGGYLAPKALFVKEGIDTSNELTEQFTKNLSTSIHKVLLGNVKAGTMCGLNYKLMSNKLNTKELKIIARSEDYPENVLGVRPGIEVNKRKKISKVILKMINDQKGKEILANMKSMKISSFIKPTDKTVNRIESLLNTAKMK